MGLPLQTLPANRRPTLALYLWARFGEEVPQGTQVRGGTAQTENFELGFGL